jgi:hypothetical protein
MSCGTDITALAVLRLHMVPDNSKDTCFLLCNFGTRSMEERGVMCHCVNPAQPGDHGCLQLQLREVLKGRRGGSLYSILSLHCAFSWPKRQLWIKLNMARKATVDQAAGQKGNCGSD